MHKAAPCEQRSAVHSRWHSRHCGVGEPVPSTLRMSNENVHCRSDVDGCDVPAAWQLCVYFQHGLDVEARLVPDATRTAHRDGSLLLAAPEEGNRIVLEHVHRSPEVGVPEPRSGGVRREGTGREAAPVPADPRGPDLERHGRRGRGLSGPRRAAAPGRFGMGQRRRRWDGAVVCSHRGSQPLSRYQDRCRDEVVIDHGLTLAAAGARRIPTLTITFTLRLRQGR